MSGRKSNLRVYPNIVAGDMSQASITSTVTSIEILDNVGVQLNWTGSPVGGFQIQVSIDYKQDDQGNVKSAGNWVPITLTYWDGTTFVSGTSVPTTSGSPYYFDLNQLSSPWIRVVYTRVSGTGVLSGFISAKMI